MATAIGATAGAGVVLSLVDRPAAEGTQTSMAAHAIVTSVHAATPPANAVPVAAATPPAVAPAGSDKPAPPTQAPVAMQAAVPVSAQDIPQVQVQTPPQPTSILATPAVAAQPSVPSVTSGAANRAEAHEANVVSPPPSPPAVAVISETPPSADVGPDVSTAPTVDPGKKPIKNRNGSGVANNANAKNKPDPGLGTVLRHLFSARAGTSYYPN